VKAVIFVLASQILAAQPPSVPLPAPEQTTLRTLLKAQYAWGYAGMEGEGKGTLNILIEPSTEKVVLELYGLGERLMFLSGDRATGYRVLIPRRELDLKGASFGELPLPFLPQLGTAEALYKLLTEGSGPGVKITKRDGKGPVKLRYSGQDEQGKDVMVWLQRTRWDQETTKPE
jgi:hypothetical protein